MRQIFRNLCLLVLGITIGLCVLEVAIRIVSSDINDYFAMTQQFQKLYVRKNSLGYRDREFSIPKPEGLFRILVLGDSQSFGHGIKKVEHTWPKRLESLLNAGLKSTRFEVINASGEGWNTDTQVYELFKTGFQLQPDLILLSYYHNDVPTPVSFECRSKDRNILPDLPIFQLLFNHSKLYKFLKFRTNRLLEKLGRKPTRSECINRLYATRGWDMEKIYLETLILSSRIKNIHFMLTVIPLFYKLDSGYPLDRIHKNLATYCLEKDIYCIDSYEETFKGKETSELVVSPKDRHLNEKAASILARVIFHRLKPLKKLVHLNRYHRAFEILELLDRQSMALSLDEKFDELQKGSEKLEFPGDRENLVAFVDQKTLIIRREIFDSASNSILSLSTKYLDSRGELIRSDRKFFSYDGNPQLFDQETIEEKNGSILQKLTYYRKNLDDSSLDEITRGYAYSLAFGTDGKYQFFEIEQDMPFFDPKVIEQRFFDKTYSPSKDMPFEHIKKKLVYFLKSNPFMGDWKKVNQWPEQEIRNSFDSQFILQRLMTLTRYGGKVYVDKMLKAVLQQNPADFMLKAGGWYYKIHKNNKRFKQFLKNHPEMASDKAFH